MGYGLWAMGYGLWAMGYGLWAMGYGQTITFLELIYLTYRFVPNLKNLINQENCHAV